MAYGVETPYEKEQRLYKESRSLKFQARELRKKRIAEAKYKAEKEERARLKKTEEAKAAALKVQQETKTDRDNRIRKALIACADAMKANGLAFDGPSGWYEKKDAFTILDRKTVTRVPIKYRRDGFEWD